MTRILVPSGAHAPSQSRADIGRRVSPSGKNSVFMGHNHRLPAEPHDAQHAAEGLAQRLEHARGGTTGKTGAGDEIRTHDPNLGNRRKYWFLFILALSASFQILVSSH
jgi:hypothetical protein